MNKLSIWISSDFAEFPSIFLMSLEFFCKIFLTSSLLWLLIPLAMWLRFSSLTKTASPFKNFPRTAMAPTASKLTFFCLKASLAFSLIIIEPLAFTKPESQFFLAREVCFEDLFNDLLFSKIVYFYLFWLFSKFCVF